MLVTIKYKIIWHWLLCLGAHAQARYTVVCLCVCVCVSVSVYLCRLLQLLEECVAKLVYGVLILYLVVSSTLER